MSAPIKLFQPQKSYKDSQFSNRNQKVALFSSPTPSTKYPPKQKQWCSKYCAPKPRDVAAGQSLSAAEPSDDSLRERQGLTWFLRLPYKQFFIWGAFLTAALYLSDFFGIVMGTFVISFIGNQFVSSAEGTTGLGLLPPKKRRLLLVMVFFLLIISVVSLFAILPFPAVIREGSDFVTRLQNDNIWVVVLQKARQGLGESVMQPMERLLLLASGADVSEVAKILEGPQSQAMVAASLQKFLKGYTETAIKYTSILLTAVSKFALQAVVSFILSFLLVVDLPDISKAVQSLRESRLSWLYNEVAPAMKVFGTLFGRALYAQLQISLVNTTLTAAGMWLLQIPGLAILSLFVFICGFIPIAGVFISTVPIGFVALTEYGFVSLGFVIVMVAVVHFVEAYILNPAIYSANLKLHPLVVLSVLVVAEHSLGVWGLLMAVPLTVFAVDYCIKYPSASVTDVATYELQTVRSNDGDDKPLEQNGVESLSEAVAERK